MSSSESRLLQRRGLKLAGSACLVLLTLLSGVALATEPKRVLIVYSFGRDFAPYDAIGAALRSDLTEQIRQPIAFQEASLGAELGAAVDESTFLEYLVRRTRDAHPDLVIAVANPAARFCLRHRDVLFPGRALLVTGIDRRRLELLDLAPKDGAIIADLDFPSVARTILELQPDTTTLLPVLGNSPLERFWAEQIQRDLAPLGNRVRILPPDPSSLDEVRRRAAALPPHSAVFYYMFAVGADGVQYENEKALAAIRQSSAAPVFGVFANQLGSGIVGGSLIDMRQFASAAAEMGARMLSDESVAGGITNVEKLAPAFDWRELDRWGIPESRLPAGSEVRFRPPSPWTEHKDLILAGITIVLLQAALISALLFQRARRRSAEQEAIGLGGRLLTAHEDERRRLARELHDDLTQRLARLAIDAGRLEQRGGEDGGRLTAMRSDLVRLSKDVHALSYRLHPSVLDDLGLVEALRAECDRVASHGPMRVEIDASGMPDALPSEASLCLYRVAQEALSNAARHASASAVTVLLSSRGMGLQLAVSDNGAGFDPKGTRRHASLGLASMRERVRLLRGELDIESTLGRGTTVIVWVPA